MKLLCYFFCLLAAVSAAASQAPTEAMPEGFAGEWDVYIVNRKEKTCWRIIIAEFSPMAQRS